MEIEGFDSIISSLTVAKKLYDIGRLDLVGTFNNDLCWDNYYENMWRVISSVFSGFHSDFVDNEEAELMEFKDDVISGYFVHAWEYGELHKLHYSKNPHIAPAQKEALRWLGSSCCLNWKLSAYIRTKKAAEQSKLRILLYNGCGGCDSYGNIAYGMVQLYTWFKNKCAEFEAVKAAQLNQKNGRR